MADVVEQTKEELKLVGLPVGKPITIDAWKALPREAFYELHEWARRKNRRDVINTLMAFASGWTYVRAEAYDWAQWKTRQGRWTTRFARSHKELHGVKLEPQVVSAIGELMRRHITAEEPVLEIAERIDWVHGAFGDENSCWLTNKSQLGGLYRAGWNTRLAFDRAPNCFAIKRYASMDAYNQNREKGTGRCWATWQNNCLYLYNWRGNCSKTVMTHVFQNITDLPYHDLESELLQTAGGHNLHFDGTGSDAEHPICFGENPETHLTFGVAYGNN